MPSFKNLSSDAGLNELNEYLASRSYIQGYSFSSEDLVVFQQVPNYVDGTKFPHVARWYKHIRGQPDWLVSSLQVEEGEVKSAPKSTPKAKPSKSPAAKPSSPKKSPAAAKPSSPKAAAKDDDFDLFGDDDEDAVAAAAALAAKKKEEEAKKAKKPAPVGKSSVVLDIKPLELETDLGEVEAQIRAITKEGLHWGAAKLVDVAYGIKKIQIVATVVDELVSVDDVQAEIEAIEGVQSTDIVAFNKL